jgi:hypothetical protein
MTEAEARAVLDLLARTIDGNPPSTGTFISAPCVAARQQCWWASNPRPTEDDLTSRLRAYLIAYLAISNGRFYCSGIPLDDGRYLRADKGVIKACLSYEILEWIDGVDGNESSFRLTARGANFLSGPN